MPRLLLFLLCLCSLTAYAEESKIQTQLLAETTKSWDGELLPKYPQGQPQVSIKRFIIPPKTALPMHKHPMINAAYVISGTLIVRTEDGQEQTIKKGDTLIELVNKWHYGRNDGPDPVELIVFYAGTEGEPLAIPKADSK